MSDNPSKKDDLKADGKTKTGWYTPQTATVEPVTEAPSRRQTGSGWRVPALPQNMPAKPQSQGDWHLPRPEDTVFTEESETEITPERKQVIESRPEDFLESLQLGDSQASTVTQAAPIAEPTPDKTDSQSLLDLELSSVVKNTGVEADDEDEDAFSMSELIALSSLVEKSPPTTIVPKAPSQQTGAQPAEVTGSQPATTTAATPAPAADDAASYARRQLEALQSGNTGAASTPIITTTPTPSSSSTDAAAYAKQQLAALGLTSVEPAAPVVVTPAAPALTAPQQALAQKFSDTETQVRTLRAQYQSRSIDARPTSGTTEAPDDSGRK